MKPSHLDLATFFPEYMKIRGIEEHEDNIGIILVSETDTAICPVCGCKSNKPREYCFRTVNDLPILGKPVILYVNAREYSCTNKDCSVKTFREQLPGFLGVKMTWTNRCQDFILSLASEMNCEAASVFCKKIGVNISGDTIIRMMLRNTREIPFIGDIIGVDDWAYKKGLSYGTLICNGQTHKPIALLPGRDGKTFREWLQNNPQIKTVTRDRASAYSSAIDDVIPEAKQIADRYHLFENLLNAVKETVKALLPERVGILSEGGNTNGCTKTVMTEGAGGTDIEACAAYEEIQASPLLSTEDHLLPGSKTPPPTHDERQYGAAAIEEDDVSTPEACVTENDPGVLRPLSGLEENNRLLILEVQRLYNEEFLSNTEIKNKLGISYRRIQRYLSGDANELCRDGRRTAARPSKPVGYHKVIQEMLAQNKTRKDVYDYLTSVGFTGSYSRLADYCVKNFGNSNRKTKRDPEGYNFFDSQAAKETGLHASLTHITVDTDPQKTALEINACKEEQDILPPLTKHEEDNRLLILEVQRLSREECLSNTEIKNIVGISYRRIKRYLSGDANELCRDGRNGIVRPSKPAEYHAVIQSMLAQRKTRKEIYHHLVSVGYNGAYSRLADYCAKNFKNNRKKNTGSKGFDHFISRKSITDHIWSDQPLA